MYLSCIVLAAGKGCRFGSNKLLAPLHGKPLLSYTLQAIPTDCFEEVLVVTRYQEIADLVQKSGDPKFQAVFHNTVCDHDEREGEGIGSTIRKGIEALSPQSEGCLFCTADQPLKKESSLRRVVKQFHSEQERIIALSYRGEKGNPVLFPRSCYAALSSLQDCQSGGAVIKQNLHRLMLCEAEDPWELYDVDVQQDLNKLEAILERER